MPIMDQSFRMSEKEIENRHEKERKKQERWFKANSKYVPHSEMCLRFGVSVGCPVCDYSGSLMSKEEIREAQMKAKLRIDKYGL